MNKKNNIIFGIILVALGVVFILINHFQLNIGIGSIFSMYWATAFIVIPSIAMHIVFFTGKSKSPVVTFLAGFLLGIGITCQISMYFDIWHLTWPCYIMAFSLGLLEWYAFGEKNKWKLVGASVLGVISLIFFMTYTLSPVLKFWFGDYIISGVFIITGILIIIFNVMPQKKQV